ncbi:MAG: Exodeoxyribonuclease 7 large subunit [Firmicutes bacterium ADurb.Bin456]|nr:MAG: Exodeoxyribonuclease 7 large subunit [Firmicutes bacterium ADurb.Bin456]
MPVQGDAAPLAISQGIELLNRLGGIELIIVGRGGGSLEEIWAFNTEIVARSIFQSTIPIISAVGHETDFTISDLVADIRASTPSAAAEIAVPDKREMERRLGALKARLAQALKESAGRNRQRLSTCLARRIFTQPRDTLCGSRQQSLDQLHRQLIQNTRAIVERKRSSLAVLAGQLQALSPLATLARGYSICTTPDGKLIIRDSASVEEGDRVSVLLPKGKLRCLVEGKTT